MEKIKTLNGYPVFEARMEGEESRIICVSLVDDPAVRSKFVAYANEQPMQTYSIADEEKRRVFGCVMRADYPMFRRDDSGREYYIVFKAEQIRNFAQRYLAESRQNDVDMHHSFELVEGAECVQVFLKDTAKGINPQGFEDIADGSLFGEWQITSDELWERIKTGEFQGFSVAIVEDEFPVQESFTNTKNMSIVEKCKNALAKCVAEFEDILQEDSAVETFGRIATDKGTIVWSGENEELKEGLSVWVEDEDGNRVDLEDGEYATGDNRIIVVESGSIKEVKDVIVSPEVEPEVAPEPEPTPDPEPEAEPEPEQEPEATPEAEPEKEPEAEPEKEDKEKILADLKAENEALKAEIEKLKKRLAEPAAMSAHEQFRAETERPTDTENVFKKIKKCKGGC